MMGKFLIEQTNYYAVVAENEAAALDLVYEGKVSPNDQDHHISWKDEG